MKIKVVFTQDLKFVDVEDENGKSLSPSQYGGAVAFGIIKDGVSYSELYLNVDETQTPWS